MKIVYFGTADFAVPALHGIAPHVCLVVTQPDRPTGRKQIMQPSPVKLAALELGLPVETPEKCRVQEFVASIVALQADFFVVAAYGQILSQKLLDSSRLGGFNLHGSILPAYRGAAPIQRCLMDGCAETGVTLMQMDRGMDTGDMIDIARIAIKPDETYTELAERLSELAASQISDWINRLNSGDYPRLPQNHDLATHAAKIERSDAELETHRSAEQEFNRYRAVTSRPGAWIKTIKGVLKLHQIQLSTQNVALGKLELQENDWLLGFKSGSLKLLEVQPEGGKRMSFSSLANGYHWSHGSQIVENS